MTKVKQWRLVYLGDEISILFTSSVVWSEDIEFLNKIKEKRIIPNRDSINIGQVPVQWTFRH